MSKFLSLILFIFLFSSLSFASVEKQLLRCVSNELGSQDSVYSVTFVSGESSKFDKYFLNRLSFYPKEEVKVPLSNVNWINYDKTFIFSANNGREGYALIYQKDGNTLLDVNLMILGASDMILSHIKSGRQDNVYSCTDTTPYH